MSNTVFQIKRSTSTGTPATSALAAGELGYSYASNTIFIGNQTGTNPVPIGGRYYVDLANLIFSHANLAFDTANSAAGNAGSDIAIAAFTLV